MHNLLFIYPLLMNETLFIREYVTFEENIKKILTEIDPQWTIRIDDID